MMNWKKWIKYTGIGLVVLTVITFFVMKQGFTKMYGGYTKLVDVEQFKPKTGPVAIKNVNVLAPNGAHFITGQTIFMEAGLIKAIGEGVVIPSSSTIIDGKGKFLIPGLIDSHVHLFKSPNDLLLYIANGVTGIREMIGNEKRLALKQQIANGRIGPQMWVASPPLGTGGDMTKWFITLTREGLNINNAKAAELTVKELSEKGYDAIKIYSHLNKESYLAATKTAKDLGMPVVGHIPWEIELSDVWENGQSEIAHLEELMNTLRRDFNIGEEKGAADFFEFIVEQSDELANNLIKHDIGVTSTLWLTQSFVKQKFDLDKLLHEIELAYVNPGMSEGVKFGDSGFGWLPETNLYRLPEGLPENEKAGRKRFWTNYGKGTALLAKELSKRGVKIMVGTDANLPPTIPGFSLHDELKSLNEAGMSTAQVLQAATAVPAEWMNNNAGKIAAGYVANLVLLDKNPLENIRHTKTINTVFSNGQVFDRNLLDQLLAAVKEANDLSRTIDISEYGERENLVTTKD